MSNLLQELQRRKVFKVAAAYLVIAWLLIQVVDTVLPTFNAPTWVSQTLIFVLLLGFPVVVVLAWAFDISAGGIHKTATASPAEQSDLRKRDYLSAALVLVLIGVIVTQRFSSPDADPVTIADIGSINSIAVLPLDNLMNDPSQDYFADGMTQEITAELAKIRALRVTSRTSVMQYRDTVKTIPQIAAELDVDALVAGSVLVDGDTVRVSAQLIHGPSDSNLWSETYTNTYESILQLHSDVALAVADAINAEITGEESLRIASSYIVDPEAYDEYLLGQYFFDQQNEAGFRTAIEHFTRATQIDPAFAAAWGGLGDCYIYLRGWTYAAASETIPQAREALLRALELDDSLAVAHLGLAHIAMSYDMQWQQAESRFQRALELGPNLARAYTDYAWYLNIIGRDEEAESLAGVGLDLDSANRKVVRDALTSFVNSQPERFRQGMEQLLEDDPTYIPALDGLFYGSAGQGPQDRLIEIAQQWAETTDRDYVSVSRLGMAYSRAGRDAEAEAILQELLGRDATANHAQLGMFYTDLGMLDEAITHYQRAFAEREWGVVWMRTLPFRAYGIDQPNYQRLRQDPRYWELMQSMNYPPFPAGHAGYAEEQAWLRGEL